MLDKFIALFILIGNPLILSAANLTFSQPHAMPVKLNTLPELNEKQKTLFFEKVDTTHPSGCHIWKGCLAQNGYGHTTVGTKGYRAHRIAYWLHFGEQPGQLFVCHTCDTPSCVNPEHMFLGTSSDNMQDMLTKGRMNRACGERHGLRKHPERAARGEQVAHAKLTEDAVREIRQLYVEGNPVQQDVADRYGVTHRSIGMLLQGKTWVHVTLSESDAAAIKENLLKTNTGRGERSGRHRHPESTPRGDTHKNSKLSESQVKEIRNLHAEGEKTIKLAQQFQVHQTTIQGIISGKKWAHVQP